MNEKGLLGQSRASKFGDIFFLLVCAWFVDYSSVVFAFLFAAKIKQIFSILVIPVKEKHH